MINVGILPLEVMVHRIRPHKVIVTLHNSTKFRCQSDTRPLWKFNNGPLPANHIIGEFMKGRLISELKLYNITQSNEGIYSCEGEDKFGSFKQNATLIIDSKLNNCKYSRTPCS